MCTMTVSASTSKRENKEFRAKALELIRFFWVGCLFMLDFNHVKHICDAKVYKCMDVFTFR